jgi:hypothetical protein
LIGREILFGHDPAVGLHVPLDGIGNPSGVKSIGTIFRDGAQRPAQIFEHEPVAGRPFAAARFAVGFDRRGKFSHPARELGVQTPGQDLRHDEPVLGQPHGRQHDRFPGQAAQFLVRQGQAAHGAGNAGREVTGRGQAPIDIAGGVQVHPQRGLERRLFAIVDRRHLAGRQADEHEAATANVARRGMRDGEGQAGRDGGIHGISALLQDRRADIRGMGRG